MQVALLTLRNAKYANKCPVAPFPPSGETRTCEAVQACTCDTVLVCRCDTVNTCTCQAACSCDRHSPGGGGTRVCRCVPVRAH